ncbi:hypothetical protein SCB71_14255 [Herbiconiux sp. KACC 21604]|uniref:hypothetical protein n=1 Tax=unclassified Herbiconiux TaxID=2618217 RepID=UPI001492E741|nr:hypothetical protein [Herbiconiux sp. SALV-R1]QJU54304.1 hypothetical protein HL652_12195 [Herbiconiux sp. SALV-R1]WPO85374.1 hypothetical protein SCB71_14255 [Herbiconiux sp. KACC 21604]
MPYRNLPGTRFTVIATGLQGVIVGSTSDDYLRVILDGVDAVTEFPLHELDLGDQLSMRQSKKWVSQHSDSRGEP